MCITWPWIAFHLETLRDISNHKWNSVMEENGDKKQIGFRAELQPLWREVIWDSCWSTSEGDVIPLVVSLQFQEFLWLCWITRCFKLSQAHLNVDMFGKGRWDYRESFKTGVKELAFFTEMQCQSPLKVFQQGGWFWILLLWRCEGRWLNQSFPTVCQKERCQGRRCLWKVKVSTSAGAWDAHFHQELLLLLTFPLVVAANSDFCMDLVHHSNFPVLGLCLKPALQLLNGEKESAKVSSCPQEQLREVLVFSNIQVKALNCPAGMRGKI